MALIEALICYILYVVVLLYYQYYIGSKCKCFTRAQLGKARAVIAALRGRVAHARARLCNETRNPAFVPPGRQHAAPPALLRLAASPRLRFRRCGGGGRESHIKRRQGARLALFSHAASRRSCWPGCSGGSRGAARSAPRLAASPPRRGCASSVRWW